MKLILQKAFIDSIKTRGEDPKEQLLGLDIKFIADVSPEQLDELDPEIRARLCDDQGAPRILQLGRCEWRLQYEKGDMNMGGNKVGDTQLRDLTFEAKPEGLWEVRGTARCNPDKELTGEIAFLIKQTVRLSFLKMTQMPLIKAGDGEPEEEADDSQGELKIQPLLDKEGKTKEEREAGRGKAH